MCLARILADKYRKKTLNCCCTYEIPKENQKTRRGLKELSALKILKTKPALNCMHRQTANIKVRTVVGPL